MNSIPRSSAVILLTILAPLVAGLIALVWGRRIRRGDLPVWAGLAALAIGAGFGFAERAEDAFKSLFWYRGWIGPREELGSIAVGVIDSPLSYWMIFLCAALSAALLLGKAAFSDEPRSERIYAAIGIGTAGVAISWISLAPWLALSGVALSVLGGFTAIGSRWTVDSEAALATRYAFERFFGIVLAILGAAGLAATRAASSWLELSGWDSGLALDLFSAGALVIGLAIQFQPFPILGWAVTASEGLPSVRAILVLGFPALAAFGVLLHLEPQLRAVEVFPVAGWVFLAAAFPAVATGILQASWRSGHASWMSAGFSLSAAVLAFSGPAAAVLVFAGFLLGASALAFTATALSFGGSHSQSNRNKGNCSKAAAWLGAGSAGGFVGFASCGGLMQWIAQSWNEPVLTIGFTAVVLFVGYLGWKLLWDLQRAKAAVQLPWAAVLAPFLPLVFTLGMIWTGTATGGAIPDSLDQLFAPLLGAFLPGSFPADLEEASFIGASWTYWSAVLVSAVLGWWSSPRIPAWLKGKSQGPAFLFVSGGYGIDALFQRFRNALVWAGALAERVIDRKLWREWMPNAFGRTSRGLAAIASRGDERTSFAIRAAVRVTIDSPAKALQVLQSGDVQWYVLFAVGSGIALLVHFSRN